MFWEHAVDLHRREFEQLVEKWISREFGGLERIETVHQDAVEGVDGTYSIDVTARFEIGGFEFLVLIECKKHTHPIKRELVQVLHDKMRAVGAQKAIMFSTAPFQSGAIQYARNYRIALVGIKDGMSSLVAKSTGKPAERPEYISDVVGWIYGIDGDTPYLALIDDETTKPLRDYLG